MWSSGHGWVKARADGMRARCGGPRICITCQREAAASGLSYVTVEEATKHINNGLASADDSKHIPSNN